MKIKDGVLVSINKSKDIKKGHFTVPDSVTSIESFAFRNCSSLTSVTIGKNVTSIGCCACLECSNLTSITIPNSVTSIRSKAFYGCRSLVKEDEKYYYKVFKPNLTCRNFQYEENKWFECEGDPILYKNGFHAYKNAFDVFNWYNGGELNKDIVIYKVELEGVSEEKTIDSAVVAKRIRLVEKINSYAELLN